MFHFVVFKLVNQFYFGKNNKQNLKTIFFKDKKLGLKII